MMYPSLEALVRRIHLGPSIPAAKGRDRLSILVCKDVQASNLLASSPVGVTNLMCTLGCLEHAGLEE